MPVFDKVMSTKRGRKERVVVEDDGPVPDEGEDLLLAPSDEGEESVDIELTDEEDEEEDEGHANDSDDDGAASDSSEKHKVDVDFAEPKVWVERMTLSATKPLPHDLNPNDDPKREEVFANHIMLSVTRGLAMLEKSNVKWRRPADYYAEMYKTDMHMDKIRASMDRAKKEVQERAHRRNMREQKKFGKEVQADVLRQRAAAKNTALAKVADWRKKRGKTETLDSVLGNDGDDEEGHGGQRGKKGRDAYKKAGAGGAARRGASKSLRPGAAAGKKKGGSKRPGKSKRR